LEARFPEVVETQPELVAQHYTAAGRAEQVVPYWQRAREQASNRSAYMEAVSHLSTGIELLKTLPDTPEQEVYRLRGVLLLRQPGTTPAEAETWLQRALDVACRQEARSLKLRAAMSLSRLWQQQGKRQEAHDLLAQAYAWFTEGFDTADLQDAKALLDTLA
jgi:predicted ATPase